MVIIINIWKASETEVIPDWNFAHVFLSLAPPQTRDSQTTPKNLHDLKYTTYHTLHVGSRPPSFSSAAHTTRQPDIPHRRSRRQKKSGVACVMKSCFSSWLRLRLQLPFFFLSSSSPRAPPSLVLCLASFIWDFFLTTTTSLRGGKRCGRGRGRLSTLELLRGAGEERILSIFHQQQPVKSPFFS